MIFVFRTPTYSMIFSQALQSEADRQHASVTEQGDRGVRILENLRLAIGRLWQALGHVIEKRVGAESILGGCHIESQSTTEEEEAVKLSVEDQDRGITNRRSRDTPRFVDVCLNNHTIAKNLKSTHPARAGCVLETLPYVIGSEQVQNYSEATRRFESLRLIHTFQFSMQTVEAGIITHHPFEHGRGEASNL
jgi:hypothetical protein